MGSEAAAFPLSAAVAEAHQEEMGEAMATQMMMQLRLLREGVDPARFCQPLRSCPGGAIWFTDHRTGRLGLVNLARRAALSDGERVVAQ